MATDKLMTYDQGQSIITDLELIATRIAAINQNIQLPSDKVTQMTGYSEPANTGAISVGDTLNAAIGKLERKADNNQNNISNIQGKTDRIIMDSTEDTFLYVQATQPTGTIPEGSIWINTAVVNP